jgi:hypothetical protein
MESKKEIEDRVKLKLKSNTIKFKYPLVEDPNLQTKISQKKEFQYKYEGVIDNIATVADNMCNFKDNEFKLAPHQEFVKRFMHPNTPYNGILLYHGLGSGKTCSAIGISEQYRLAFQHQTNFKKIMIVASPNVQKNFRLQLFDEYKVKRINNSWNISTCVGEQILHELKDQRVDEMTKEKLVKTVDTIINNSYRFIGYGQLANEILSIFDFDEDIDEKRREKIIMKRMRKKFEDTMIVIDEAHNIRKSNDSRKSESKRVSSAIIKLFSYIQHIKLVLLTGTPMYDDPREIVFLLNILNMNDKRSIMMYREIFDVGGNITENGKMLLKQKMNGYISYVRGENPYSFPFKVYPAEMPSFQEKSIKSMVYPEIQYNQKQVEESIQHLDLFMNSVGEFQSYVYQKIVQENSKYIIENLELSMQESCDSDTQEENDCDKKANKKNILIDLLSALNISYPYMKDDSREFIIGKPSLKHLMNFDEDPVTRKRSNFAYKDFVTERIFDHDFIGKYSSKFHALGNTIKKSEGIILVYSQFIDSGLIPIALMLEEMGFKRADGNSLMKNPKNINYNVSTDSTQFHQAKYCIISGDKGYSPNNSAEMRMVTSSDNVNGEKVKVVLVSQAGSEGLDFKNLRQVHIIDPWYNMNRIEQIVGRAVRNCSHKDLDLSRRNVQIFLYGSYIPSSRQECIDLYIYRHAEMKSKRIGVITRMMKESSIDCILNNEQQNFLEENLNQTLTLTLSNQDVIDFNVGDKPHTSLCDYSDDCNYTCLNKGDDTIDKSSFTMIHVNNDKILKSIKHLYELKHVYTKDKIVDYIHKKYKNIQDEEVYLVLDMMINDPNVFIIDKYLRKGTLVNYDNYYIYQPLELQGDINIVEDNIRPPTSKPKGIISQIESQLDRKVGLQSPDETRKDSFSRKQVKIIDTIREKIIDSTKLIEGKMFKSEQESFEKTIKKIVQILNDNFHYHISESMVKTFTMHHICDTLSEYDTKIFLTYLFKNEIAGTIDEYDKIALNYYAKYIINEENRRFVIIQDSTSKMKKEPVKIYIYENEILKEAQKQDFVNHIDHIKTITTPSNVTLYNIVCFMDEYGKENTYSLKCREPYANKKPGSFIENKSPKDIIPIINKIAQNTEFLDIKKAKSLGLLKHHLVHIVEILLRQKEYINEDGKRYIFNNIEKKLIQNVLVK